MSFFQHVLWDTEYGAWMDCMIAEWREGSVSCSFVVYGGCGLVCAVLALSSCFGRINQASIKIRRGLYHTVGTLTSYLLPFAFCPSPPASIIASHREWNSCIVFSLWHMSRCFTYCGFLPVLIDHMSSYVRRVPPRHHTYLL